MADPDLLFEHRLGLALGKSCSEIRSLPYPEFRRWQLMYILEPWGWVDREQRTATLLAKIHNSFISKSSQAKKPTDFMRDMPADVSRQLAKLSKENHFDQLSQEERRALVIKSMKESFGV